MPLNSSTSRARKFQSQTTFKDIDEDDSENCWDLSHVYCSPSQAGKPVITLAAQSYSALKQEGQ